MKEIRSNCCNREVGKSHRFEYPLGGTTFREVYEIKVCMGCGMECDEYEEVNVCECCGQVKRELVDSPLGEICNPCDKVYKREKKGVSA